MQLMNDKVAVVFGVANKRSIAWGITKALADAGATIALNYQNDRMGDAVRKLAEDLPETPYMAACDVTNDDEVAAYFDGIQREFGRVDALVHSIATAKREELGGEFVDTSWEGYALSQQVSAYSLIALARHARPLMKGHESAVLCLTYYGAEKVVDGYNVMGVAKSALESNTRYLAANLGPDGIRVNALSAGPIKTVSAMGVSGFSSILDSVEQKAPLRRNVTQDDVGQAALFLLSDMARGITGQTIYVDSGYSIIGV
ncbi:MAG: enoyl-ACP reductase [Planctomycetes bacterium]|nr:enoyl-ACP reductase [Planctomycetota bacterium]